jgi:hypothetical protein
MKSVLARRVASGAAVTLVAAALSLGASGTAHAITTIDLEGTITAPNGVPLEGMRVFVEDAATQGDVLDTSVVTDAAGHYEFSSLDFDGNVLIGAYDSTPYTYLNDTQYLTRWYGGSKHVAGATPVALTTDGDTKINLALPAAAVITGTVAAADGHALTNYFSFDVIDSDWNWPSYDVARDGINYKIATEPGTYRIGAYGSDSSTATTPYISYLEKWWTDSDTPFGATQVTVPVSGVGGLNFRLTNQLTARQAPSISGFAAVGRPLTATPGTWTRNAGTEFSYTWMRGATVVGTGATYTPTAADFGQRLNVVVRALNGSNAGQAASAQTDPVRWASDAKGRAKGLAGHKVRFAVKIVSAKQKPVHGKVVVLRGTKVVHKAVKLVKGKAVIIVKHQPKGKQVFTVLYKGNKLLAKAAKDFTVRVHK